MASPDQTSPISISFTAPSTFVEPSFWEELYRLKLNVYRLDAGNKKIAGFLSCSSGSSLEAISLSDDSFAGSNRDESGKAVRVFRAFGELFNVNTVSVCLTYFFIRILAC
jgi:hypothetical protein